MMSLIGGAFVFTANRKNLTYAACQKLAGWSAVSKLEELKGADYSLLTDTITIENLTISGYNFQRKTTIQAGVNLSTVTVALDWGKGTFPVSLTTYISGK